jgi:excisionase family DNA binding protein
VSRVTAASPQPPRTAWRTSEAAASLGISEWQVRKLIRDGVLEARRLGGRVVIPAQALAALLDSAPRA